MVILPFFRHSRRRLWGAALALVTASGTALFGQSGTPSANDGFNPNVTGTVNVVALQPDGKILVGGTFTAFQPNGAGQPTPNCNNLARLNADGTVDNYFKPEPNGQVLAICLQPDGKILVGGYFTSFTTSVNSNGPVVETRNGLARLNADGTLDETFDPNPTGTYSSQVDAITLQPDGKILVGGAFTTLQPMKTGTVYSIPRLARLNADGTVDSTFKPNPDGLVSAIYVQSSGKILVGGGFQNIQPNGATTKTLVGRLTRLNTDGTLDAGFIPAFPDNLVQCFAVQSDGKILAGGQFITIQPVSTNPPTNVDCILRMNADGSVDSNFLTNFGGAVQQLLLQPDGRIIAVGTIGTVTVGTSTIFTSNYAARLNADGTPDTTFVPSPNYTVFGAALQPDGKIILGGAFTQFQPNGTTNTFVRHGMARINSDGTLDDNFNPDAYGGISVVAQESDGSFMIGGEFSSINGVSRTNLAHVSATGVVDPNFSPSTNGPVYALVVQASGQVVIGGAFTAVNGYGINYLARLNTDGSVDKSFNPNPAGVIYTLLIQPDKNILVGGNFVGFEPANGTPGSATVVSIYNLGRLKPDGTVDILFQPNPSGSVYALQYLSSSNIILVGGNFAYLAPIDFTQPNHPQIPVSVAYLAEVSATNGLVEPNWVPNPNNQVNTLAVQANGQILMGGAFTLMQPNPTTSTQVVNGLVVTTTTPKSTRNYLARINADATLDTSFTTGTDAPVLAVAIDPLTSKILVGGSFANFVPSSGGSVPRGHVGRLNTDGSIDTTFSPSLDGPVDTVQYLGGTSKALVTGSFTTVEPAGSTTLSPAPHAVVFNADGSVSSTLQLNYQASPQFKAVAVQGDGRLVVAGTFSNVAGAYATNIIRFNNDTTQDTSFFANANGPVNSVVLADDGTSFVGGAFTAIGHGSASNFAHLHVDSTLDTTFTNVPDGPVNAVLTQTNAPIILGGSFAHVGSSALANLARLTSTGAVDTSFAPNPNGAVTVVAQQPDGKYLVGGAFTTIAGHSSAYFARLNTDGSFDGTFAATVNAAVGAILVQPDGKILIGGAFTTVAGSGRTYLARLNADGSLDSTFNPGPNGAVSSIVLRAPSTATGGSGASTDQILVGGSFTTIAGGSVGYLARLNYDGSLDSTFNPAPNGAVTAIAMGRDGKPVVAGAFTSIGGSARNGLARIADPVGVGQTLAVSPDFSAISWTLTGGVELSGALFEYSTDDATWTTLGYASRVGSSNIWKLANLKSLPSGTTFYILAVGVSPTSQGSSSSTFSVTGRFSGIPVPAIQSAGTAGTSVGTPFYYEIAATNAPTSYSASGLPVGLTINTATGVISGTPTTAGTYTVTITASSAGGTTTGTLVVSVASSSSGTAVAPFARLTNLSTRSKVSVASPLIAGFSIGGGAGSKSILLRAVGPGLSTTFGIGNALTNPYLKLYNSGNQLVLSTKSWDGSATIMQMFSEFGAFPLIIGSADAAVATSLAPASYTEQVIDGAGTGGTALAEIYDADAGTYGQAQRLTNLSGRGNVAVGSPVIGGFVIGGTGTETLLLRAVGPGLATTFGVPGVLATPTLSVYDSGNHLLAQNTGWGTPTTVNGSYPAASASTISADAAAVGAFSLVSGSADSVVVVTLAPGAYTAQVTGGTQSGVALFEVYEVPGI
jgi:uncharacterized delta-60 repeat protein